MDYSVSFADMCEGLSRHDEAWRARVPQSWRQGRTCFGGLTTGLAYAAATSEFPDLPPLRSVVVNFTGPVGEAPDFAPTLLRRGRNMSTVGVDVMSEGQLGARITFSFGHGRDSTISKTQNRGAPATPLSEYELFTPKAMEPFVPNFFLHFDTRLIEGHRPMSGADDGHIFTASRHKDVRSRAGMAALLAIADVLPPAALPMSKTMGPVSSVNWMINILTEDISTDDGWWLIDTRLNDAGQGYSSQTMTLWDAGGRPVIDAMQSVALFL
ncbi:thioesterase family protein [Robiginitomaculum antarcticum]|uniref:thioesterase family protein n=1 Tax=Robiginitomaculum antarcticum TaxID=437507 RepID=UPI000380D7B6|nr:thioesterase family protein [Robiginitomaculum antarcticum]